MTGIAAVILAGGRGERLGGVIKANLVIGTRLLDRVGAALVGADIVLVAHGAIAPEAIGLLPGQIPVPDPDSSYGGPLAGLAGAVAWALAQSRPPQILVLAPVDTPFLPPDYLSRLVAGLGDGPAAVAAYGDQPYPTSSAWRLAAIADLPDAVRASTAPHSLKRLAERLGAVTVPFPAHAGGDPFANANTPAELEALRRRAET